VNVSKTGQKVAIPILAGSMAEGGRGMLPVEDAHEHGHQGDNKPWYPKHEHKNYRWGMAIDLESCIGCNACVAACYVENNLPLVGADEHLRGREMSWLRIQPYFDKKENIEFLPMLCQHCDNAPCEPVCPVYAAYHNPEGLNVQVYNRCVGTRYCSNNCPYKVRRFNWFDYHLPEPLDKMYNPDLSVRGRGIMEKCTFCIQRIRAAKDHAKDEGRLVQDGEVVPACAQTCPTNAITFGNLEDKNSRVYQLAHSQRAYHALEELGTEPAVNYLRKRGNDHEA
jgi:molybdopterin-containing oxidoreductase family iron-sulfur binding subunit